MRKFERGSVLMEFLIVMPIYMLLLGAAFVFGELALQSIHLAGGADRTYAMASGAFDTFKKAISPHSAYDDDAEWNEYSKWKEDDEIEYDYSGDPDGGSHKASKFEGKDGQTDGESLAVVNNEGNGDDLQKCLWTRSVAAYVQNNYTLTPVTRGFVAFWFWDIDKKREEMGDTDTIPETALSQMLDSGIGRAAITGKDLHDRDSETSLAREYGYYSLQRNERARTNSNRYRAADAGALAQSYKWQTLVADEQLAKSEYSEIQSGEREIADLPESLESVDVPEKQFPDSWTR